MKYGDVRKKNLNKLTSSFPKGWHCIFHHDNIKSGEYLCYLEVWIKSLEEQLRRYGLDSISSKDLYQDFESKEKIVVRYSIILLILEQIGAEAAKVNAKLLSDMGGRQPKSIKALRNKLSSDLDWVIGEINNKIKHKDKKFINNEITHEFYTFEDFGEKMRVDKIHLDKLESYINPVIESIVKLCNNTKHHISLHLAKSFLNKQVPIIIDRPLNSQHPKYNYVYPVNYGYIPNTEAPDGEELDAYVLGVDESIEQFKGICIAVIHRKDNDDDKLIVVPEGTELTDKEILKATHFQEQRFDVEVVRS